MTLSKLQAWVLSAALACIGATAMAQVSGRLLTGSLKSEGSPATLNGRPAFNWELENGAKEVLPDRVDVRRELAVVLVSDRDAGHAEAQRVEVAFSGGSLLPATIVVRTGTTLLVRNDDEIPHALYAPNLAPLSPEPTTARGRRSITLPNAGNWPLRDRLVPHVHGHLHVLANLVAVATLDAAGQFAFSDVAPGPYTLKVFQGEREVLARPVELGTRALTLDPITLSVNAPEK